MDKPVAPNMLPDIVCTVVIPASAIVAIIFGLWLWKRVSSITLVPGDGGRGTAGCGAGGSGCRSGG
jgi:hypothetical protein